MKTYTSPERKLKKVMVEKRRRTRIDRALVQMKTMVLEALHVQPEKYQKMEKADILDLTVRFLRRVRQERQAAVAGQADPRNRYPAAAAMYGPGYQATAAAAAAAAGASAAASNPYPFKIAPLRPIPTSMPGHPYAHIPRGPYRPLSSHRFNPLKVDSATAMSQMTSQMTSPLATPMTSLASPLASQMTSMSSREGPTSATKTIPRRVPTATVTSSEVAEASSTSRGPDSPNRDISAVPMTSRTLSSPHPARATSPCSTVTSSSEHKADSNNNDKPQSSIHPGPSTSRQTPPASGSSGSGTQARIPIQAPIALRMFKFDGMPEFPLFGPGVWRPWFA